MMAKCGIYNVETTNSKSVNTYSGAENLKKSRPKKSNQLISRNFFWPKSIFCIFNNGQKSIFELGKSFKLPKMQFHEKQKIGFI